MAQVAGSLISAVRDACRNGLLDWSPRLMLAMYTCDIQASSKFYCHLLLSEFTQRPRVSVHACPSDLID